MKDNALLWETWETGLYIGDMRPCGRVTVEETWRLRTRQASIGTYPTSKMPVRWWQRADNSQTETEVPNVANIQWNRTLDSDAATCTLMLKNQRMDPDDSGDSIELGTPGYYTFSHGASAEAQARWRQTPNEWADVLVPGALFRTYEGYGGHDLSIDDAVDAGYLELTGVWVADDVDVKTDGTIQITCRDMGGALLIDQPLYPPLVPSSHYPLRYYRWLLRHQHADAIPYGTRLGVARETTIFQVPATYDTSGGDVRTGVHNAPIHGHKPSEAFDGRYESFWLTPGNSSGDLPQVAEWIQVNVNRDIDAIQLAPWKGYYLAYISIMEAGAWQTDFAQGGTIGYTGSAYTGGNTAAIPYVMKIGLDLEYGGVFKLPRSYRAQKVRITLTNLALTDLGPNFYRGGLREFYVGTFGTRKPKVIVGIQHDLEGDGYWLTGSDGGVFTYGNANFYGSKGGLPLNGLIIGSARSFAGKGYWLGAADGGVFAFGDARFHGSLGGVALNAPIVGIERHPPSSGYYMVGEDGGVFTFGGAVYHGSAVGMLSPGQKIVGMAVGPHGGGYWLVTQNGAVFSFGGAAYHGGLYPTPLAKPITAIESTESGNGYWLVGQDGGVFAFGDAHYHGGTVGVPLSDPVSDIVRTKAGDGYWLVAEDGGVFSFGDAKFYGSMPNTYDRDIKLPGNYKDYTDIIKDLLLWSGWWLYEPNPTKMNVYGNLESTGAFSEDLLPEDIFDKQPVINAITRLKETVGYLFWIDDEGGAHFESPNWWQSGNFLPNGHRTSFIPEIDERRTLLDYAVRHSRKSIRSEIIISTADPTADLKTTITTRYQVPFTDVDMRGIFRPAMWTNEVFTNREEQRLMAQLIALHIWFARRQGSTACVGNPCIQINDQVRLWERQTSETYIHYVRGVSSSMDLETGEYTMQLTTNWLGDQEKWAITADNLGDFIDGRPETK